MELCRQPDSIITRPPDVGGNFPHLLAEDPGRVGVLQQAPKIGFERMAAFAEQVRCRGGEREYASHNLITGALDDLAGNLDPLWAVAPGCAPDLCLAIALVGRQILTPTTDCAEVALNQLVDGRTRGLGMWQHSVAVDTTVRGGMHMHARSTWFEHA